MFKTVFSASMIFVISFSAASLFAHCDTLSGPVVMDAKKALDSNDVTAVLKWVKASDENTIKTAFKKTLAVRAKGPEAKDLADMYFFETLVRIHRAGEGAPYTGLKADTETEPIIRMADTALENGNSQELIKKITDAQQKGLKERFEKALQARKNKDKSVQAGREYVESYVEYIHYAEALYNAASPGEGHGESQCQQGHAESHEAE